ncbi:MAG: radical SAM protein [Eubacteriales bacterium]|nr:radical SAM protein [Eubacteriales bacterium]MDY5439962.1 radical SAM protein [Eubacteriales bacterium]
MIKASYLEKLEKCNLCPNNCSVNRFSSVGRCKIGANITVAKAYLHTWEEPVISGKNGSGTIFFSGCSLGCVFCQNYKISSDNFGKEITPSRLADIFKSLEEKGAENINLVTPTPHVYGIIDALNIYRPNIPIVYNSSGYESVETLKLLDGYVDVYLPDFKYYDNDLAYKFSNVRNYREITVNAIDEMLRQTGKPKIENGLIKKGVIIRHLVLPSHTSDSIKVMDEILARYSSNVLVSLMGQYTPVRHNDKYAELNRKVTPLEYKRVLRYMQNVGLTNGFCQELDSSATTYIPSFDLEGV